MVQVPYAYANCFPPEKLLVSDAGINNFGDISPGLNITEELVDILFSLDYSVQKPLELLEIIPVVGEDVSVDAKLLLPLLTMIYSYGLSTIPVGVFC